MTGEIERLLLGCYNKKAPLRSKSRRPPASIHAMWLPNANKLIRQRRKNKTIQKGGTSLHKCGSFGTYPHYLVWITPVPTHMHLIQPLSLFSPIPFPCYGTLRFPRTLHRNINKGCIILKTNITRTNASLLYNWGSLGCLRSTFSIQTANPHPVRRSSR